MIIKTKGIVLKTQKYSESSLICRIFTKKKGLKSYIISGVRKQNPKVGPGLFQIMSLLDLVVYDRDNKDLNRIKEVKLAKVFQYLPYDIKKSSIGTFIIEIIQKTIKGQEENEMLFDYLEKVFSFLDQTNESVNNVHLHFLLEYSSFLGFNPSGLADGANKHFNLSMGSFTSNPYDKYSLAEEFSTIISDLLHISLEESYAIEINNNSRKSILNNLLTYYRLHLENFPEINSHQILSKIL